MHDSLSFFVIYEGSSFDKSWWQGFWKSRILNLKNMIKGNVLSARKARA